MKSIKLIWKLQCTYIYINDNVGPHIYILNGLDNFTFVCDVLKYDGLFIGIVGEILSFKLMWVIESWRELRRQFAQS